VAPRDVFADPFEDTAPTTRPGLVMIDDDQDDEAAAEERAELTAVATSRDVLISRVAHTLGTPMERYASVLQQGLYAAAYLRIGLGQRS
ncbi:MAG: hypothetical protein WBC14_11530, partial [Propionicimonas sp.]